MGNAISRDDPCVPGPLDQHSECRRIIRERNADRIADGDFWIWLGNGEDHLESMGNGMMIAIRAGQLRELLNEKLSTNSALNSNQQGE